MYDFITPGGDILDLRDIVQERDRILGALRDASADVLEAEDYKLNTAEDADEDRCSNDCVCTLAERIENDTIVGNTSYAEAVEGWDALLDEAGVDEDEVRFADLVADLESETGDLVSASSNEPTLILDDHFENYAEQLADDLGAVDRNAGWPTYHIDWKAAADDLRQDYTEVEFGGHTYQWRAC